MNWMTGWLPLLAVVFASGWLAASDSGDVPIGVTATHAPSMAPAAWVDSDPDVFKTSDRCLACHKGVTTPDGTDVSIGYDWRASMMANSARDPYWHAAVRREIVDHPAAEAAIEAKCSRCHMPMANATQVAAGDSPGLFEHLPIGSSDSDEAALAADGVSCAACHQIAPQGLGTEASYTGGFVIDTESTGDSRPVYGPFEPDEGGAGIMHSATGFLPTQADHIQSSELCASCHTLFTHTLLADGSEGGEFPEQVPYLEWKNSDFAAEGTSCQDCHMPEVTTDVPVTGVLGRARSNVSRHVFRGGNFFMIRMLNRYREELGVAALPQELSVAAQRTEEHLRTATVELTIDQAVVLGNQFHADISLVNKAGHKFPTAYPSRRAWLHVTVKDQRGGVLFESGAFNPDGRIVGNDNDNAPATFEPHYDQITEPTQVQIYEAVMLDENGAVTTGLMSAASWAKENRLQPRGFDASGQERRIGSVGLANEDDNFVPGGDRVRYSLEVDPSAGPFTVEAEVIFQPIAYRWAENLADYDTPETQRFVRYYRAMAEGSALVVAEANRSTR